MKTPLAILAVLAANAVLWPAAWYLATAPVETMAIKQQRNATEMAAAPSLGEVLDFSELSPVQAYSRPLFSKSRRPWQPPAEPAPEVEAAPAIQEVAVQPIGPPQATLVGISATGGSHLQALLQLSVAPEPEWFIVGDELDGWTISKINEQSVVMQRGDQSVSFDLYPETSAGQ